MPRQPVVVVTGPPGAGKSTVARLVAERFDRAVCMEADWFWTTVVRGFVAPWHEDADPQNRAMLHAVTAAAAALAGAGYAVVVEGVVGPWYLDLVAAALRTKRLETHYVVLRPRLGVALARATGRAGQTARVAGHPPLVEEEPVVRMWEAFADVGEHEPVVIDTSDITPRQVATQVWKLFTSGALRL